MSYANLLKSAANIYYDIENNSCKKCHECSKIKNHYAPNCQSDQADNNNMDSDKNLTLLQNLNISDATESLYYAIKQENPKYVAKYLDQEASIDIALNQLGHTPLHLAAIVGNKSIVTELMKRGANWKVKDVNGACVLHTAVKYKWDDLYKHMQSNAGEPSDWEIEHTQQKVIEVLTVFLDLGLEVDSLDKHDRTPLAITLENRMDRVVEFLIDRGADVNYTDRHGNTFMHRLTTFAHKNPKQVIHYARLILLLIRRGASVDRENVEVHTPIELSVKYNLDHITFVLLQHIHCVHLTTSPRTVLHVLIDMVCAKRVEKLAQDCGIPDDFDVYGVVERLIEKGASVDTVDEKGYTPLHVAVKHCNDEDLMATLLKYSQNIDGVNNVGDTMLHTLIEIYNVEVPDKRRTCLNVLKQLVGKGANVNKYNQANFTAVHICVRENLIEVLEILKDTADFHVLTKNGDNAFHLASKTEDINRQIIDILLMQGYDLTRANRDGLTPLHLASQSGNLQVINVLLDQGVDVNYREQRLLMRTPLLVAAEMNNPNTINLLLNKGADANARESSGKTALLKINCRKFGLINSLLQFGADLYAKDNAGRDLLYNALERNEEFGMKRLYNLGTDINKLNFGMEPKKKMIVWFKHTLKGCQFYEQIVKLEMAGLPVAEFYKCYTGYKGLDKFCNETVDGKNRHDFRKTLTIAIKKCKETCSTEIEAMKAHSICENRLTIYDFLRMPLSGRSRQVEDETLSGLVNLSSKIEGIFPGYCGIIRASYNEAVKRRSMQETAYQAFCQLCNCNMPDLCVEYIFDNLSNDDLNCVIVALNKNSMKLTEVLSNCKITNRK